MLDELSSVPLYKQLYEILLERISSGVWSIDKKIPSEQELCRIFSVSRMTVRLALADLEKIGVLYRKQGRGTFITQPKFEQTLTSFYSFGEELQKDGKSLSNKLLSFQKTPADKRLSKYMLVSEGTLLFRIERVRCLNDHAFAYEISYLPFDMCPDLNEKNVAEKGLYNSIFLHTGRKPSIATETYEAIIAGKKIAGYLQTSEHHPILYIRRTAGDENRAMEYCDSYVRGDMITYTLKLNGAIN